MKNVPEVLDKMADAVLAYRPTPKSKAAKKRAEKLNYCIFKSPVKVWHDNLNDILSFLIYAFSVLEPTFRQENHKKFSEKEAKNGSLGLIYGKDLLKVVGFLE